MTIFKQIWERLDQAARIGLVLCLFVLAGAMIGLSFWFLKPDYQVLFSDLAPADAAAMTTELDHMKIPYHLDGGGNTILVLADEVYKTRLKLVGRDLPLHGTIGFELFNNADIGMTEFAQKVNYQRALQGELTRTILSYEEIQAARVHLALPEQTLFKKTTAQAKASVSLTLKPGKTLQPHEVQGIQRLVAASVPDIQEQDVTVIDQHGVALTRPASSDSENTESGASNLDSKEAIERYFTHKVSDVLDRTFGAGQSIASVDVVLNHDAVKTTTENVLGSDDATPTGVIVHEHQTGQGSPPDTQQGTIQAGGPTHPNPATSTNRDVDYQVGRRVEQVVTGPGTIDKINVAVVVRQPLDASQIDRISDIIAKAVGIDKARGDGIAVYTITQFGTGQNTLAPTSAEQPATAAPVTASIDSVPETHSSARTAPTTVTIVLVSLIVPIVLIALGILLRSGKPGQAQPTPLTHQEREELLARVRHWLDAKSGKHGDIA
ncbi:flagellar basal-body MS-ring/collar protein FliF [Solimicrobium silvestre]|uniref:Flagellar M-ring protein n=1 Tax=Solimicrobium silvestre TaxID=2099400 RepID=A0A2S9H1T2_9BURK|nr:flagellar basal-body MS-ring/collar protein FliF [Solimicrobium silvestre]PRC93910.1 fliF: flagellar M-ring protein FliF [Solimicrobium silvestre]